MTPLLVPIDLRCAHRVEPLGVASERVRFSWSYSTGPNEARQAGYRVRLAATLDGLADDGGALWDSGDVAGDASYGLPYGGPPLQHGERYFWRVRCVDDEGGEHPWSEPASFEVAIDPADWSARWIGLGVESGSMEAPTSTNPFDPIPNVMRPAAYLRRSFVLAEIPVEARLYATALGVYTIVVNGQPVSDALLAPGWTDYTKRQLYQTYDVGSFLVAGENVLAAIVADGWAAGFFGFDAKRAGAHYVATPGLLVQLRMRGEGGEQMIVTDEEWRTSIGEIIHADLLMGESRMTARRPHGWDAPGFDDREWSPAARHPGSRGALEADPGPPIRPIEELAPRSIVGRDDGSCIVDFGQNLAGWVRLSVDTDPGTRVRVRHGEVLAADGSLYVDNLRTARQIDEYITAGGRETLSPSFTFHGFRYAEVLGLGPRLDPSDVAAVVVHSDIERTGHFTSSAPKIDRLFANIDWGQRGNFIGIPTDCPQRDERFGWLGDAQIFVRTAAYNRDVQAFFAKWLDDVADAQFDFGAYADIAPRLNVDWAGAPAWGDAGVIVPWTIYRMYGDTDVLDRHYDSMARWMDYIGAENPDCLRTRQLGNNYGDWLAPQGDRTPRELLATAYWAYDATLMAEIATALGRNVDAASFAELAMKITSAFRAEFVSEGARIASDTQTAYVLALHMGLLREEDRHAAADRLVVAIEREGCHLTTGFVGVGYLLPVLSSTGHLDTAYQLLEQESYPSWLYTVDRGATTIWERWDGWTEERGFQAPQMNSFNHYSLGSVGEWLYRYVLGIEQAPQGVGFSELDVRPHPGGSLTFARGSYRSVRGEISSAWKYSGGDLVFELTLPPNTRATVSIPSTDASAVRDNDGAPPEIVRPFAGRPADGEATFVVGSGSHRFVGPAPSTMAL